MDFVFAFFFSFAVFVNPEYIVYSYAHNIPVG